MKFSQNLENTLIIKYLWEIDSHYLEKDIFTAIIQKYCVIKPRSTGKIIQCLEISLTIP